MSEEKRTRYEYVLTGGGYWIMDKSSDGFALEEVTKDVVRVINLETNEEIYRKP